MIPIPQPLKEKSRIYDLKERLDWGEPALTIIDVRSRNAYNSTRITGAVSLPMSQLVSGALNNFELERDIYVYGRNEQETAAAAAQLRAAGYKNVAELVGGFNAWKAANFPIEGNSFALV